MGEVMYEQGQGDNGESLHLPLFYETSYFAVSPRISGLDYSVYGGHITFRFCE